MQLSRPAAPHHVGGARHCRLVVLSVAVLLVVLLSHGVEHAQGFAFVPVVNTFARPEGSGHKIESRLVCQEGGGYIAGEPTAAAHTAVIEAARGAGAGTEWYAYLGASTDASPAGDCPPPLTEHILGSGAGLSFGCYWRWNQGRWTETDDNPELPLHISNVGVTFYIGNYFGEPTSPSVNVYGVQSGFPSWFNATAPKKSQLRPSSMFGQDLLAVGNGDTSTWSDNKASGGYTYAGFLFSSVYNGSRWKEESQRASRAFFWAVCQTQGPSRMMYELHNTSSSVQNNWWVIFFSILMVLCLVVFIVTACCQDNEGMDEPPEDAPEWAQEETNQATRTKSFVSTRSFVQQCSQRTSGDYDGDMGNSVQQLNMKQGTMYGDNHSAANQMPPNQYPNSFSSPNGADNEGAHSLYTGDRKATGNWM
ncbi:hypothetical protein, unknown function [Leishmania donovani]|uniref:Uncharacterized protein n=1 Tax=Leishmania donovani TaxID=5661 RepID=A0A3S5H6P8_LEIDO|nr:hypothetical protein, unknown function [Leishmania donovani]AYU77199.1 hypothetical protein LdCL_130017600 [Leishmania donovani]TPP45215.1 hypothetical protein CGC21_33530 [Leishmania donovani]CBZ32620.1 hypothetical protein, unknown function [Leishmania donovani]